MKMPLPGACLCSRLCARGVWQLPSTSPGWSALCGQGSITAFLVTSTMLDLICSISEYLLNECKEESLSLAEPRSS